MEEPSEIKLEDDGSLALLERGYEEIPEEIATKYGKATKTLNLSENNLKYVLWLGMLLSMSHTLAGVRNTLRNSRS